MTTAESLTTEAILDAFGAAIVQHAVPRDALKQAVDRWEEVGPVLIAMLEAAIGAQPSQRDADVLCFGIYLMAQLRDTRAYRPLCSLAAIRERLDPMIGDGITEDFGVILARVYDGDQAPLRALVESEDVDEFVRDAALGAVVVLTASGRIGRDETAAWLRRLHAILQPQEQNWVWVGWQQAIALLCLDDLVPLVEDAFAQGWIGDGLMSLKHFQEDLSKARQAAEPASVFNSTVRDDGRFEDVATLMADWFCFQPERPRPPARPAAPVSFREAQTVRNPYRGVGRNDPCPCGSGKKFKKCCLNKVA